MHDFRRFYGISLNAALNEGLVEASDLCQQLLSVPDSHLLHAFNPETVWDQQTYLQAAAVDYLAAIGWSLAGKGHKPKPVPRPQDLGVEKPLTVEQLRKDLAAPRRPLTDAELTEVKQSG